MILADRLVKRFSGRTVVDEVSFSVKQGEVIGFLGPNGAGKSTTMRMVVGCLEPDGGRALVNGCDPALKRREAQEQIGYLPEGAPAYHAMTARGFVRFCLRARGFKGEALTEAAETALKRADMGPAAEKAIGALSKGYKRRAALAAAIAHDPPVLILDEPTDGLDPNQKDGVRTLITEMARAKAIIISTHLLDEVDAICTRAAVIAGGKILADDTPAKLAELGEDHTIASAFRALTGPMGETIGRIRGGRAA
ncbi:MAG: ABC transporter ATP-binding protein [Oceanicaulis sp.]